MNLEPNDEVVEPEVPAEAEGEADASAGTETPPLTKAQKRRARAIARATAPLREQIKQLEAERPQQAAQAEDGEPRPKPKRADFADDEAFEDELVRWGNEKFAIEKALSDAQAAERRHLERNLQNYAAQLEEVKAKYPDWDELKEKFDNADIFIGQATQLAILGEENGAEVSYYLMKHPAVAVRLGQMDQIAATKEVARLADRLKTGAPAPSGQEYERQFRLKPKVPAPVRTVSTAGSNAAPSFADIAARPNYPGKAKDLKRALAAGRG